MLVDLWDTYFALAKHLQSIVLVVIFIFHLT